MRHDQPKPDQPAPEQPCQQDFQQASLIEQDRLSRQRALTYLVAQLVMTLLIPAMLLLYDTVIAYSALAGATIATVANMWFTLRVFRVDAKSEARTMLASVYVGEVYKIMLTGALFICVFVMIKPINALALFLTYFLLHITPLLVNVFDKNNEDIQFKSQNSRE